MEVIDLGLDSINIDDVPLHGSGIGLGAELLMNDKKRFGSSNITTVDMRDLDRLENELNGNTNESSSSSSGFGGFSGFGNFFGGGDKSKNKEESVQFQLDDPNDSMIGLGEASASVYFGGTNNKSVDGFSKINDIPPDQTINRMSERELKRKKRMMIKKMEEWYEKGYTKTNHGFTVDSAYEEVEDEYESAMEDKRRKESIKMYGWWFQTMIHSVEYANSVFDPFDVNLDGWGEQVSEDIESYEDIFSELHQKWRGGKMAPEVALLLKVAFSGAMINFTNKSLSASTPQVNDILRSNPDLMKSFTKTMTQTMSNQHPAFKFANDLLNKEPEINTSFGAPPVPMNTKIPSPSQRGGYPQQPQQNMMFREKGIDLRQSQQDPNNTSSIRSGSGFGSVSGSGSGNVRTEMRGPQLSPDIASLLNGLKPIESRSQNQNPQPQPQNTMMQPQMNENMTLRVQDNDSFISTTSMQEMLQVSKTSMPTTKRRGRKTSDKTTIALDI